MKLSIWCLWKIWKSSGLLRIQWPLLLAIDSMWSENCHNLKSLIISRSLIKKSKLRINLARSVRMNNQDQWQNFRKSTRLVWTTLLQLQQSSASKEDRHHQILFKPKLPHKWKISVKTQTVLIPSLRTRFGHQTSKIVLALELKMSCPEAQKLSRLRIATQPEATIKIWTTYWTLKSQRKSPSWQR